MEEFVSPEEYIEFLKRHVEKLKKEITRLNLKMQVIDPNFDKNLSEIEVNY